MAGYYYVCSCRDPDCPGPCIEPEEDEAIPEPGYEDTPEGQELDPIPAFLLEEEDA